MKQFRAQTIIDAPPEAIWEILTDAPSYPEWDPNMERLEGRIALGEKITAHTKISDRAFPVTVSVFEPGQMMVTPVALGHWSATELGTKYDDRIIEHAALLQINKQCGCASVHFPHRSLDVRFDRTMVIPVTMIKLDEAHTSFCEPACQQAV